MQVVRWKLSADQVVSKVFRVNTTTHHLQFSPDSGTTWIDSPALDPRTAAIYRMPALTGGSAQCDAAARMVAELKAVVDTAIAFDNSVRLATELLALISLSVPELASKLLALIFILVDVILALGASAIEGSFTSTVYNGILCILVDNIGTDGQMTDAQLSTITTDINAAYDGNVQAIWAAVSSAHGAVGWSNAGVVGVATGDCTTCQETCHQYNPPVVNRDYTNSVVPVNKLTGTYDTGYFAGGKTLPITKVRVTWTASGTGAITFQQLTVLLYTGTGVYETYTTSPTGTNVDTEITVANGHHFSRIYITWQTVWSGGGAYDVPHLIRLEYAGVATPFGWSHGENCS